MKKEKTFIFIPTEKTVSFDEYMKLLCEMLDTITEGVLPDASTNEPIAA